jgi:hypothetical protein
MLESATRRLGQSLRRFKTQVCDVLFTSLDRTPDELAKRDRQQARAAAKRKKLGLPMKSRRRPRKLTPLNLQTAKFHKLGHYHHIIRENGTSD